MMSWQGQARHYLSRDVLEWGIQLALHRSARVFTNGSLSSRFDAAGNNIKCPWFGTMNATRAVGHDEIVVRVGVPCPERITAFNQVINDNRLSWLERVAAIATFTLWCGLL